MRRGDGGRARRDCQRLAARRYCRMRRSPAEFYKGKNVDLYIGYSVGGAYDLYARVLARHLGKHIPGNPTIVPKNMEGAGSLRLANWLYNVGAEGRHRVRHHRPRHRLRSAARLQGARSSTPTSSPGSAAPTTRSASASPGTRSGITKFEDMLTKELIVGGTGAAADTDQFPRILNGVLGTKMQDRHRLSRRQRRRRSRWSAARCRAAAAGRGRA